MRGRSRPLVALALVGGCTTTSRTSFVVEDPAPREVVEARRIVAATARGSGLIPGAAGYWLPAHFHHLEVRTDERAEGLQVEVSLRETLWPLFGWTSAVEGKYRRLAEALDARLRQALAARVQRSPGR